MSDRKVGEWFGYPKCCIDYFVSGKKISELQYSVANYHGFVPCPEHTEQINNGTLKLNDLIKNRTCKQPFPVDYNNNESRYTKAFLHPSWMKRFKTTSFIHKVFGIKLQLKQRNRRK